MSKRRSNPERFAGWMRYHTWGTWTLVATGRTEEECAEILDAAPDPDCATVVSRVVLPRGELPAWPRSRRGG